ncbi:MAG: hypothetical protein IKR41_11610 [Bacteroidales bacterium]|nr:hypothetical protein [Bacteroidales bacterium]
MSNFIGKALFGAVKKLGLKPSDITDFIEDEKIDGFFTGELGQIRKDNNAQEICLIGYISDDGKLKIRAVEVLEGGKINRSFPMTVFGKTQAAFPLSEILKLLIANTFNYMKNEG